MHISEAQREEAMVGYSPDDVRSVYFLPVRKLLIPELLLERLRAFVALLYDTRTLTDSSIVDKHIDVLLILRDFLHQLFDRRLVGDVHGDGDNLTARVSEVLPPCLNDRLQSLWSTSRDVYACTVVRKCLGNHEADARATASDDSDPSLDVEEAVRAKLRVIGRHVVQSCDCCGRESVPRFYYEAARR